MSASTLWLLSSMLGLRFSTNSVIAVKHRLCTIKQWMNQSAFPMRGLNSMREEFSLTTLAYNIKRAIITIVGRA